MTAKKVLIVNAGGWMAYSAAIGSYDKWVETMQESLTRLLGRNGGLDRNYTIEIVDADGLEDYLNQGHLGGVTAIVFVTRGMLEKANQISARYGSRIRILLLTGDPPAGPIVLNKGWVTMEMLAAIVR